MKVLVLTKARYDYSSEAQTYGSYGNPIGLLNGGAFLADGLREAGVDALHLSTADGNSIDREVTEQQPDLVVLEALWATPAKMTELTRLHPRIHWVVRLHSNIPFLAMEGMAFLWAKQLQKIARVTVASNNRQTAEELSKAFGAPVAYLPNIYLLLEYCPGKGSKRHQTYLDISCFGAMRPFKNHLLQAVAAQDAATELGRNLRFHINGTRLEQRGDTVMQNLVALFDGTQHQLVSHPWQSHEDFLLTVAKMDLGLQVSFTESFNIVAADHVHVGVPLVVSDEVSWLSAFQQAKTTSAESITRNIIQELQLGTIATAANKRSLEKYNAESTATWLSYLAD